MTYGVTTGLKLLNITDHAWDRDVPCDTPGCWPPLSGAMSILPLPQSKQCRMLFGLEADMNYHDVIGLSKAHFEALDFIVIAPDHLNLKTFALNPEVTGNDAESHYKRYKERIHAMLAMDLPFHKTTIAHFSDGIVCDSDPIGCISRFTDAELTDIFTKIRDRGMGVELNLRVDHHSRRNVKEMLRPLFIARDVGCKFTFGGDAHEPEEFIGYRENAEKLVTILGLEEKDKLPFIRDAVARAGDDSHFLGRDGL